MGQFSKPWKELTFADNYIFCKVMLDEELCKKFIEILLGIKIAKIEYLNTENQIENYYDSRGVRLDVYVKDSDRIFDIEIQTGDYDDLLLRARYYQGACDVATTKRQTRYLIMTKAMLYFIMQVRIIKNAKSRSEWEDDYMNFQDILEEEKELAREAGHAEGLETGLAEGRQAGLAEGREEMAVLTAKNFLKEGDSPEKVSRCTGLSLEKINELAAELN